MSAEERSGWRDEALSLRHREWGFDCPAVDIDFLLIEYDKAEPRALIEYKNQHAQPIEMKNPSIRAIKKLADDAQLPALLVRYADDFSWWKVRPLNENAKGYVSPYFASRRMGENRDDILVNEIEYVAILYSMRDRQMPQSVISHINELHASGGESQ